MKLADNRPIMIKGLTYRVLIAAAVMMFCWSDAARAQTQFERTNRGIVQLLTGPDMTSIEMAKDLARLVDDRATRRVLPVVGSGSGQNLTDLQFVRGIDVGVVRLDTLEAVQRIGPAQSLTYITRLNAEPMHVLVPATVNSVAELAGKRVGFADTAVPAGPALFELLGIKVEAVVEDGNTVLQKLRKRQTAAAVFIGAAPIPALSSLGVGENLRLLPVPDRSGLPPIYAPAQLSPGDYPGLLLSRSPISSIGVGTAMVVAPLTRRGERYGNVAGFVEAFFTQFPNLQQAPNQAAWKEVDLATDLPGWQRFPPAAAWLQRNAASSVAAPADDAMRVLFSRFLDERSRLASGGAMSEAEKEQIFNLFQEWVKGQQSQ